jgi:starch synthase
MRVLHVASEVAPYSKTGGLADVLGALPAAEARQGADVIVATPRYRGADPARFNLARRLRTFNVPLGQERIEVGLYEGQHPSSPHVKIWMIDHPPSFDRDGLYVGADGKDHPDNARRFALLGAASLTVAGALDAWPHIVHGHDWQAGPALLYAAAAGALPSPRCVFTVHNLAYQGIFPPQVIAELGLPAALYHPDGYEFYGQVSFLKAGLAAADRITTVSPRYAREIQTEEQGAGLDGFLRARAGRLSGILNGVDYNLFSPERDQHLPHRYSRDALDGKRECKAALQRELGLPIRADTPLCGTITRLTEQKGIDLMLEVLPRLLDGDVQCAVLGTGDPALEGALTSFAQKHPKKLAVRIAYDDSLAHRMEAGCDLFVMPSRFEPCGLNQLYSLKYGTPPIVRATGGLDDTIVDHEPRSRTGTGFKFEAYSAAALEAAWRRALSAYARPDEFAELQRRAMAQDFSWAAAARAYMLLYRQLSRD